jgi:hypothetical protein
MQGSIKLVNFMSNGSGAVQFKNQAASVETQVPGLHAGSLAEAFHLKRVDYRGARATIEITQDNIRDFCNYMGTGGRDGVP